MNAKSTGRVLVTGSAGFIGGYLTGELLEAGYSVVGLDNYSKYGKVERSFQDDDRYQFVHGDAKDAALVSELLADCDYLIAAAAKIGGISYFHEYAYDLIAENERIVASACDAGIRAYQAGTLKRVVVLSSSMVYENATILSDTGRPPASVPAPLQHIRIPEACVRVFRAGNA